MSDTTNTVISTTIQSVMPYIILGIIGYLGLRWIQQNNPLGGLFPGGNSGSSGVPKPPQPIIKLFGNQQPEPDPEVIIKEQTQGKRLQEQKKQELKEMEQEDDGEQFTSFEEHKTERQVEQDLPTDPETEKQKRIKEELVAVRRAETEQRREAAEKIVNLAEQGKVTGLSQDQITDFNQAKRLHQRSVQEEKEIQREAQGKAEKTAEEKRIEQEVLEDLPHAPETEKQKRIKRRLEAIRRAEQDQSNQQDQEKPDRQKDADVLGFDIPFV